MSSVQLNRQIKLDGRPPSTFDCSLIGIACSSPRQLIHFLGLYLLNAQYPQKSLYSCPWLVLGHLCILAAQTHSYLRCCCPNYTPRKYQAELGCVLILQQLIQRATVSPRPILVYTAVHIWPAVLSNCITSIGPISKPSLIEWCRGYGLVHMQPRSQVPWYLKL